jgi:transposase
MMGKKDFKPRIFYRLSLEKMVPQDHLVRALEEILDMNFIRGLCRKYYSHKGQPSVDPIVLFKMMLVGYLFGITSERKLADECTVNLAFRWYLGYDLDEATPNHSVISKARERFGKKVFEEFFQKVLSICIEKGLVKGEKIFADGTLIKANASLKSLVARSDALSPSLSPNEYVEKIFRENPTKSEHDPGRNDDNGTPPETNYTGKTVRKSYRSRHKSNLDYMSRTDPEASYIARKGKRMFSYKYHFTIDQNERVITAVAVTPGAITEDRVLEELLDRQPVEIKEICADSQYGTADNYAMCWKRDIVPTFPRRSRRFNRSILSPKKFRYDEEKDVFICPSGKELRKITYDKRNRRWHYRARGSACRLCSLKSVCSPNTKYRSIVRHEDQEYVEKSLNWLESPCAKLSIKERACYAEWAIAEAKCLHGLSKTRYRGLERVAIQGFMTASVQNIKRLLSSYRREWLGKLRIIRKIRDIQTFLRTKMHLALIERS